MTIDGMIPEFRVAINQSGAYLDFRTKNGVPFSNRGRYFDSFEHCLVYDWSLGRVEMPDNWIESCKPWLTKEQYTDLVASRLKRQEEERLRLVSNNQPWEEN